MSQENNFVPEQETYKPLSPFKLFVKSNFPFIEATYEALDNYGLYCKIVEYLNNVIENENSVEDNVTELYNSFVNLNNYVSNYFDNLDVQEEINNKLDAMAESGQLQALLTLQYNDLRTEVNERIDNVSVTLQEEINSITSGAPAGVYATVDALTAADPNHSKIYLVTADGKWYYYSTSNSTWVAGGTYQSTGIADGSIVLDDFSSEIIYNNNTRTIIKDNIMSTIKNKINYVVDITDNSQNIAITNSDGKISNNPSVNNNYVTTPKYIYIPKDFNLFITGDYDEMPVGNNLQITVLMYDKNFSYIGYQISELSDTWNVKLINNTDNCSYVRLKFNLASPAEINVSLITTHVIIYLQKVYNVTGDLILTSNENLLNEKYNTDNCYIANNNGNLYYSESYVTSAPIELKAGESYTIKNARKGLVLSKNKIGDNKQINRLVDYFGNQITNYTYTASIDSYLIISYSKEITDNMVVKGDTLPAYTKYKRQLPNDIDLSNIMIPNILYNKNYVALGDSFTHGDFSDSQSDDYTIESGLYAGQYKVYPYLIGNRNNMNVTNLAQNGMRIAGINNTLLATIPENVDYISIKIGINDDHNETPIGEITDNTDSTFYGSYNRIMLYLIEHYPQAKIGIIASNGISDDEYITATLNIAKKYGVACLNESTDNNIPLLIRTLRDDVSQSIKTARDNAWEVLPGTNNHPNAKCHEYESTIVENFLQRL